MECAPTARLDVVNVACALPFNAPLPSVVLPSMKVTLPVGLPDFAGVTVAVKVTSCANADGFTEEMTAVDVPIILLARTKKLLNPNAPQTAPFGKFSTAT